MVLTNGKKSDLRISGSLKRVEEKDINIIFPGRFNHYVMFSYNYIDQL